LVFTERFLILYIPSKINYLLEIVMKKHFIIIWISAVILVVGLSGCIEISKNKENEKLEGEISKFIGTWEHPFHHYTFMSDGTYKKIVRNWCYTPPLPNWEYTGIYKIEDGNLTLIEEGTNWTFTYSYSFSGNDTILTLFNIVTGSTVVYTKQL